MRRDGGWPAAWAALLLILTATVAPSEAPASPLKPDETLLFFPTDAAWNPIRRHWVIPVHGWVYELEADSAWRRKALNEAAERLGVDKTDAESQIFRQRAGMFLIDSQSGKRIEVRSGPTSTMTSASQKDGHVFAELLLPAQSSALDPGQSWISYRTVSAENQPRRFAGRSQRLGETGISVISDIDDTIKSSDVLDKRALLENTFLREFKAIPIMPEVYRQWADQGVAFHYVSSSPWQLYPALSEFLSSASYPEGSLYLRQFSFKIVPLWDFIGGSGDYKPNIIRRLLERFPGRRFVLVGDSGEQDPEVYGAIAREFPRQVLHIFIRDLERSGDRESRMREAFHGLAESQWSLFKDPSRLREFKLSL